eukprot:8080673-Pyramimonas_sp.AAC.1
MEPRWSSGITVCQDDSHPGSMPPAPWVWRFRVHPPLTLLWDGASARVTGGLSRRALVLLPPIWGLPPFYPPIRGSRLLRSEG